NRLVLLLLGRLLARARKLVLDVLELLLQRFGLMLEILDLVAIGRGLRAGAGRDQHAHPHQGAARHQKLPVRHRSLLTKLKRAPDVPPHAPREVPNTPSKNWRPRYFSRERPIRRDSFVG